jgi:hypothetical protein
MAFCLCNYLWGYHENWSWQELPNIFYQLVPTMDVCPLSMLTLCIFVPVILIEHLDSTSRGKYHSKTPSIEVQTYPTRKVEITKPRKRLIK